MIQIEKVEISYFRSIYSDTFKGLGDLSVLCGKNDTGKSNYLRALNLFFNNQTDWKSPLNFYEDFNLARLEECRNSLKGKQFIRVKVHFLRGNRYENSLPEKFWVSRTWGRGSAIPQEKSSLTASNIRAQSMDRAQASLQRYLTTIHYEYIPAIKDRTFFTHALSRLQEAVMQSRSNTEIKEVVENLNNAVITEVTELKEEFRNVANIDIDISLPTNLADLFGAFSLSTHKKEVPFTARGDGIQARFLPSLLHHISEKSKLYFVWGFEEPENCMEHSLATKLADEMESTYSKNAQIVLTSHSAAFLDLKYDRSKLYRIVRSDENGTRNQLLLQNDIDAFADLGLLSLQKKFQKEYEERITLIEDANSVLEEKISTSNLPILLVEGKTDELILNEAWRRTYEGEPPFRIECCSTTDDAETAGCGILKKAIESGRPSMQSTLGLFDYDHEGIDAFENLDKNFQVHKINDVVKVHKNNVFAAMVYPDIPGIEEYRNARNLCIEFLFPEEALQKKIGGHGLQLKQQARTYRVGRLAEGQEETTEPQYRSIGSGKMLFANKIVPTLDDNAFINFGQLFGLILETFESLQQIDN